MLDLSPTRLALILALGAWPAVEARADFSRQRARPHVGTIPALPPDQTQPLAPGTQWGQVLPIPTLSPAAPQVHRAAYLSNGFIAVAHAVVPITLQERAGLKALVETVARRVLDTRPALDGVDLGVYDRGSYASLGATLPLLTASVPLDRLKDFSAWAPGASAYERVWRNPGNLPEFRAPDQVRGEQPRLNAESGLHDHLLYKGKPTAEGMAALTFDDAPHPLFEPPLLDLLRRSRAHATFFVIGRNARAYPYFIRDMVAEGHEVGNHTYHHLRLPQLTPAETAQEMDLANGVIRELTGRPARDLRPPRSEYIPEILRAAGTLGLTTVFWTDGPGDFLNIGDDLLRAHLDSRLRPGGSVLLHDNASEMLDVLRALLTPRPARGHPANDGRGSPK